MSGWQFWVDRGGTFTDVVARTPDGVIITRKLLSEAPELYSDAAIAGIKDCLGIAADQSIPDGLIDSVKMGTTVATNALLERKGEPTLVLLNRGFADLMQIGNQARPRLFDLNVVLPARLSDAIVEIDGRVDVDGREIAALDEARARRLLRDGYEAGYRSCAICLIHAWKYPEHEIRLAALARDIGFTQVSLSHEVSPLLRLVPRADTTVVDSYLTPILRRYVDRVSAELDGVPLFFMQSNGGLTVAQRFQGKDAILSGPAGGIVGAARTASLAGLDKIIAFDMGGTSTDVALYAGEFERTFETTISGVRMRTPMMAIKTVAAGGGSVLTFDGARFRVGPESAGADPGPASYRRGGPLTVTDANVCLGKIQPSHFPALFGPNGNQPIDATVVGAQFEKIAAEVAKVIGVRLDAREVAEGFLRIAIASMANAVKTVSLERGFDLSEFALQCFGGAGPQHACLVADALGMQTVLIHPYAGVLSAYGMGLADQSELREQAIEQELTEAALVDATRVVEELSGDAGRCLAERGARADQVEVRKSLLLRYAGTEASLIVELATRDEMVSAFESLHRARFGFATQERALIIEAVSIEARTRPEPVTEVAAPTRMEGALEPIDSVEIWSGGRAHQAPVFERSELHRADRIEGPALIRDSISTIVVEPGWKTEVGAAGQLFMRRTEARAALATADLSKPDPVLLEFYNNVFMSVAEQMGTVLRKTSLSVNIKERLDFSCAIFDGDGNLVANAPHVPVHLGAMGESVRSVIRHRGRSLRRGDVIALNNPYNGGTHLPDITVITPVFGKDDRIIFFVGNRGHHADIGGTTPGSTPADSRTLEEEGVVIDHFLLVEDFDFKEAAFRELLAGARYPARNPDVNVADIKAQVAANNKGVQELEALIAQRGAETVLAYMRHVMDNAEESVRRVLDRIQDSSFTYVMDDGAVLAVAVSVDRERRSAVVDFSGTSPQRPGNFNAPRAITIATVLYVFRCLVGDDIPLNEGCLKPIEIRAPEGSFLSPTPGCAVVAGNTEISQAVCNALLGALGAQACSQATMNNLLFGDATHQYYETICGGTGAGPGFDGCSAVHSHMTNTRITDPEVLELRYPVRLEAFSIRLGSGGHGKHRGGDGVVRRIRFLAPLTAVLVGSRRTQAPFGLHGGSDGLRGRQWVERANGRIETLSGTSKIDLAADDVLVIETPGGGGYGAAEVLDAAAE